MDFMGRLGAAKRRLPRFPLQVVTNQIKTNAGSTEPPAVILSNQGFEMDFDVVLASSQQTDETT